MFVHGDVVYGGTRHFTSEQGFEQSGVSKIRK